MKFLVYATSDNDKTYDWGEPPVPGAEKLCVLTDWQNNHRHLWVVEVPDIPTLLSYIGIGRFEDVVIGKVEILTDLLPYWRIPDGVEIPEFFVEIYDDYRE